MMSVFRSMTLTLPVPVSHSPKAIVLVAPSVIWARPKERPPPPATYWKTPLGGGRRLAAVILQARAGRGEVVVAGGDHGGERPVALHGPVGRLAGRAEV